MINKNIENSFGWMCLITLKNKQDLCHNLSISRRNTSQISFTQNQLRPHIEGWERERVGVGVGVGVGVNFQFLFILY